MPPRQAASSSGSLQMPSLSPEALGALLDPQAIMHKLDGDAQSVMVAVAMLKMLASMNPAILKPYAPALARQMITKIYPGCEPGADAGMHNMSACMAKSLTGLVHCDPLTQAIGQSLSLADIAGMVTCTVRGMSKPAMRTELMQLTSFLIKVYTDHALKPSGVPAFLNSIERYTTGVLLAPPNAQFLGRGGTRCCIAALLCMLHSRGKVRPVAKRIHGWGLHTLLLGTLCNPQCPSPDGVPGLAFLMLNFLGHLAASLARHDPLPDSDSLKQLEKLEAEIAAADLKPLMPGLTVCEDRSTGIIGMGADLVIGFLTCNKAFAQRSNALFAKRLVKDLASQARSAPATPLDGTGGGGGMSGATQGEGLLGAWAEQVAVLFASLALRTGQGAHPPLLFAEQTGKSGKSGGAYGGLGALLDAGLVTEALPALMASGNAACVWAAVAAITALLSTAAAAGKPSAAFASALFDQHVQCHAQAQAQAAEAAVGGAQLQQASPTGSGSSSSSSSSSRSLIDELLLLADQVQPGQSASGSEARAECASYTLLQRLYASSRSSSGEQASQDGMDRLAAALTTHALPLRKRIQEEAPALIKAHAKLIKADKASTASSSSPATSAEKGSRESKCKPAKVCALCGVGEAADGIKLRKCGSCNAVRYCSTECQRKHWKGGHKQGCKEGTA